jgi:hypothetical protein
MILGLAHADGLAGDGEIKGEPAEPYDVVVSAVDGARSVYMEVRP